jgi:sugar transferase (PEP-CTERM/EpsH1 system associated)
LRLLFLTPQLPYPPHQGTTIRNFNLIARLARQHQVHLLSFVTPQDQVAAARPLQDVCVAIDTVPQPERSMRQRWWTTLTSPLPDMAHRLSSRTFDARLRHILAAHTFDVVEFEGIEMVPYLPAVRDHSVPLSSPPRLVFDDHNAEYVLQKRVFEMDVAVPRRWLGAVYSFIQWKKLERYEAWACRHVHSVAAVSDKDAQALQRLVPGLCVHVVPNGVDIASYAHFDPPPGFLPPNSLVFTGKMDFRPNIDAVTWFARYVFPLVQQDVPDVRFYIVGQRPHARLDRLRDQQGVVITGRVPDARPYIGSAAIYVIPLRSGGGTRLKVLEAMAMRRAIVSTTMGCDGFPITAGHEAILADDAQVFARQVVDLLRSPGQRAALGQAAFDFASTRYDWSAIVPRLEAAYHA